MAKRHIYHNPIIRKRRKIFVQAEFFQSYVILQTFFDVIGWKTCPHNIGDITWNVIKNARVNCQIVRESEKPDATSDARADYANFFIALLSQLTDGGECINHRLPQWLQSSPDIRRDEIISTFKFGRHSFFVIRQSQTERRNADLIERVFQANSVRWSCQ